MMNAHYIEFFFDCSSPWTYLSFKAINQLANENNIEVKNISGYGNIFIAKIYVFFY